MKEQAIRTTVDIPASLYRKLKEQAAAQGRSIRELILLGVRVTLIEGKRPRAKRVKFPLIASDGPKVDLTNEQIYEHVRSEEHTSELQSHSDLVCRLLLE